MNSHLHQLLAITGAEQFFWVGAYICCVRLLAAQWVKYHQIISHSVSLSFYLQCKPGYMNLTETLLQFDKDLFTFIHTAFAVPFWDRLMLFIRRAEVWIPLYSGLLYWIITKHRRFAVAFVVCTLLTFAITDFVSASIIKPYLQRLRPCHDPQLAAIIRPIISCGGLYGLPSSHASNHFGLACFWTLSIARITGKRWRWLWWWAAAICIAQVYVGKHFPGDVLAGALFGTLVGYLMYWLFIKWTKKEGLTGNIPQPISPN